MTRRSEGRPTTVEVIGLDGGEEFEQPVTVQSPGRRPGTLALLGLVAIVGLFVALISGDGDPPVDPGGAGDQSEAAADGRAELHSFDRLDALITAGSLPPELLAAEVYQAAPGADTLRFLLRSMGGVEGITAATAEGSFDVVSFNPRKLDQLAASRRSGYGPAQNQEVNEAWLITSSGAVLTSPLAPGVDHDVAFYNDYGTVSFWSRADGDATIDGDFAPRTLTLSPTPALTDRRTEPLYPSRSVIVDGTLFALTGSPDYYSNARKFLSLIADRGEGQIVLADGARWAWIDSPMTDVAVAYPVDKEGLTTVWSASTLERLDDHPLAGRRYRRLAVAGNETTMVGVTFDGTLEVVDLGTDRITARFGQLDPSGIADPITLNNDGTIAVTVDHDGQVTLWWVGDPDPIVVIDGDAGPPRLVSEYRAPRVSSAVAPRAERVAVRNQARPEIATTWSIVDTNPARWVEIACERAGRRMTSGERIELGLDLLPPACR